MTSPANNNPNSVSKASYTDLIHEEVGKGPEEELSFSEWVRGGISAYFDYTISGQALSWLLKGIGSQAGCPGKCDTPECFTQHDNDADGYDRCNDEITGSCDCEDSNNSIHPDAPETCNDVDDNCDGLIDDADPLVTGQSTWYPDADRDGLGDMNASPTVSCYAPTDNNYVQDNHSDCDDSDPAVGPSQTWYTDSDGDGYGDPATAVSLCPDDATGLVDNGDDCDDTDPTINPDTVWYSDADGDTYGDVNSPVSACESGAVPDSSDCNDGNPAINPGETEILNGVDENCDGSIDNIPLSDADAKLIGEIPNDGAGLCVAGAGDVNGDGFDDLLIGAVGEASGGIGAGAAYLIYGPVMGDIDLSTYGAKFIGEAANDNVCSIAGAGDMDGNGYNDVLVGATSNDAGGTNAGAAYLVYGPKTGSVNLSSADAKFIGETDYDYAGYSVAGAGDVDDDGNDDLLVGALRNDAGGQDAGAAYLVYGPNPESISLSSASVTKFIGEEANDSVGFSIAGAGDVDGDGLDDLLIGAYQNDAGGTDAGAAYLVYDPPAAGSSALSSADTRLIGERYADYAGYSVAGAGDINGDGLADLLVGALQNDAGDTDAGAAYIIYGPPAGGNVSLSTSDAKLIGETAGDYAGFSVDGAGDVDGNSYADVLVGAYQNDSGGTNTGGAYLVYGGSAVTGNIDLSNAGAKFIGEAAGDGAGYSIAGAGDVDGNSLADLLIGAYGNDAGGADAGAAYLSLSRW